MDHTMSLQAAWIAIHGLGLLAAWWVRISSGSRAELLSQAIFLCSLATVALATLAGRTFCWPLWTLSAATLGTMIVAVLVEFSDDRERVGASE